MVEHSAVNRGVVGSSLLGEFLLYKEVNREEMRLHGQAVKTPPFHGGNRGSNPLGVIKDRRNRKRKQESKDMPMWLNWQSS